MTERYTVRVRSNDELHEVSRTVEAESGEQAAHLVKETARSIYPSHPRSRDWHLVELGELR